MMKNSNVRKCMRPLEASCASNCAGTVDCFTISGPAQLYIYIYIYVYKALTVLINRTHTYTHTDRQTNRQTDTHTHTIHAQALSSFKLFKAARWKIEKCSTLHIICCICNVYCMLNYTAPCILYCVAANCRLVQIFIYLALNLAVQNKKCKTLAFKISNLNRQPLMWYVDRALADGTSPRLRPLIEVVHVPL